MNIGFIGQMGACMAANLVKAGHTQQFNTTTSMGRLTLNVLLSFAQFEREVSGERIRDRFVMSGWRPLIKGYFAVTR